MAEAFNLEGKLNLKYVEASPRHLFGHKDVIYAQNHKGFPADKGWKVKISMKLLDEKASFG